MTRWLKVNADAVHHPKAAKAGPWGWAVREAAWHIAKALDCPGGDITAYWSPDILVTWSPFLRPMYHARARAVEGMVAAVAAGLVDYIEGRYVVHDWDEHQSETATARARRRRAEAAAGKSQEADDPPSDDGHIVVESRSSDGQVVVESRSGDGERVVESWCSDSDPMISPDLQVDRLQGDGDGDGDGERKSSARKKPRASLAGDQDVQAATHWLATHPWHVARPTEHGRLLPQYAEQMGQLRRLDRRSSEDIRRLTDAIAKDIGDPGGTWRGWAANCIAPRKLRLEDRQGRRYWDVLWAQLIDRPRTSASRGHIGVYRSSEHVHDEAFDINRDELLGDDA